jgi:hypothetical protein
MEKLTLSDLCVIIPLLEKELDQIHIDIESEDDEVSNDAAELSAPYGNTSTKLKEIYESMWSEDCNYPPYQQLVKRK